MNKEISHLRKDPKMRKIIDRLGDYEIQKRRNKFESLINAIITQQLSGSAAKSISNRFCDLFTARFPKPQDVVDTPSNKLRKIGLSKMKVDYIKGLARKIQDGELKLAKLGKLSDEEVIEELIKIKGIGRWTAQMFLIFTLGRMDILPTGDLGLQKGVMKLYSLKEMPDEKKIEKIAQKWKPFRTIATWYLWKSLKNFDEI